MLPGIFFPSGARKGFELPVLSDRTIMMRVIRSRGINNLIAFRLVIRSFFMIWIFGKLSHTLNYTGWNIKIFRKDTYT
jgi:hypothetical protein